MPIFYLGKFLLLLLSYIDIVLFLSFLSGTDVPPSLKTTDLDIKQAPK